MKRNTKYVALDIHRASTVSSVREEGARVIARTIVPTEASAIVAAAGQPAETSLPVTCHDTYAGL